MDEIIGGLAKGLPPADIGIERLLLDPNNPRLASEGEGEGQPALLKELLAHYDLVELAHSFSRNGYFDEEPLIAVPADSTGKTRSDDALRRLVDDPTKRFVVVEGNRRLATLKILMEPGLREKLGLKSWPVPTRAVKDDLKAVPVILYKTREEVIPYLGVRHITGIKKWEAYAKALYISEMTKKGLTVDYIQEQIGDRQNSARRHLLCLRLTEIVSEEFGFDVEPVKDRFSYLMLAVGQAGIKRFLGIPLKLNDVDLDDPVKGKHHKRVKELFSWLFGEGKSKPPVIHESRDITNFRTPDMSG